MAEVKFYDDADDALLKFAVIIAQTNGKWVFCKHRERDTYEIPGGHRESGEDILTTAKRKLREETGAVDFTIRPICVYSVKGKTRINERESILITDNLVDSWTYPLIQPKLLEEARNRGYVPAQ